MSPSLTRARSLGGYVVDANLSLLNGMAQFLGGLKLAISQNLQAGFVRETGQTLQQLADRQLSHMRQQVGSQAVLTGLAALLGTALVLAGFGWFHVPRPVLVALALVATRMVGPLGQIQQGAQQFRQSATALRKSADGRARTGEVRRQAHRAARTDVLSRRRHRF